MLGGTVKNAFAQAEVGSEFDTAAGLVGYVNGDLKLENAYFAGKVSSEQPIIAAVEEGKSLEVKNVVNWTSYSDTHAQKGLYIKNGKKLIVK